MNQDTIIVITTAVLFLWAESVLAFQEPFVSSVGKDAEIGTFYLSNEIEQFTRHIGIDEPYEDWPNYEGMYVNGNHVELMSSADGPYGLANQPEICDTSGRVFGGFSFRGNWNVKIPAYTARQVEWKIMLLERPNGPLNIAIQCGTVKQDAFARFTFAAVKKCAGHSGELQGSGICDQQNDRIKKRALPTLSAKLVPGYLSLEPNPYYLTAIKNPGNYRRRQNVTLNGSSQTRFVLEACFTTSILVRRPVGPNGFGAEEGDVIEVMATWPNSHPMDVYCHPQSVQIMGIGAPLF